MDEPVQLGSFKLGDCIGQGGMGRVYRAVHATTGVSVAVKVIRGAADGDSKRHFHREVQAHAGLVHPGVVYLFDYGTIDERFDGASDYEIVPGSPYVVMELSDRGTVRDHMPCHSWHSVRQIVLQVLDALAFAHARGVIHRDLKPENFLLFSTDDGGQRVKLADFGLAHALGEVSERSEQSLAQVSGTPFYMTPEQIHGAWRTYGPWTDLYAVGCIAWHLVCGRQPHVGKTPMATALKHCTCEPPPLEPLFPVPAGVEEWIHRAMAQEPEQRFQRAADAAQALPQAEGEADETVVEGHGVAEVYADTLPLETLQAGGTIRQWHVDAPATGDAEKSSGSAATFEDDGGACALTATVDAETKPMDRAAPANERGDAVTSDHLGRSEAARPPVPTSWRAGRRERLPAQLVGTGLGLFGLREVPFVDRDGVRDKIWTALREVAQDGALRVVLLAGESGVGKSRLARWMATRAHEVGAAELLRAVHTPGGRGPTEGFAGLIQRAFHTWKLSRQRLYEELLQHLPRTDREDPLRDVDARALTELVHPTDDNATDVEGPRYQFSSTRQKHALIARLLHRVGMRRTPVLWLDDLQYSSVALGLVEYLLELSDDQPAALILATLRSDVLADNDGLTDRVAAIADNEGCLRVDLDPIDATDHRELIDLMLPLAPDLADTLARRTEGNPLFAHHLLSNWIAADTLAFDERGFRVADGAALSVPDDIHRLWMERVERLLAGYPRQARVTVERVLELAAALGREVDHDEWQAACSEADCDTPPGLKYELIDRGLAEHTEDGWAFTHGLLVDSLARRAQDAGRWREHHRCCARMLEERYPQHRKQTAQRRAEHWIAAEEFDRALEPLLTAAERFFQLGESAQWKQCTQLHRQMLDRLNRGPLHPDRLENELLGCMIRVITEQTEVTIDSIEDLLQKCRQVDDDILTARAHELLAVYVGRLGNYERQHRELEKARELTKRGGDEYWQGKIVDRLGDMWFELGKFDRAEQCYRRSKAHFRRCGAFYDELLTTAYFGWIQLNRGQFQEAIDIFRSVYEQAADLGYRRIEADCLFGLGDASRFLRQFDEARRYCNASHQIEMEIDDHHSDFDSSRNFALVELGAENWEEARTWLQRSETIATRLELSHYDNVIQCGWLLYDCGRGNWSKASRRLDAYAHGWPENCPSARDDVWLLRLAAEHAEKADKSTLASRIWRLAADLYQKIGDDEAAERAKTRAQTSTG